MPVGQEIATQTFLGRIAPSLEPQEPATLLEALLNQLPPDIRRVIVRVNGLDGQPLSGLKEVAREFRMSREQVRALVSAGEKRLTEVVNQLTSRRQEKREA
jgi:DNA-directed RNA polymerase sigma subunit (sigma70/sigma32)